MANDRIQFDNGTNPDSVVSNNNPLPVGGGALGSITDPKVVDGDIDATAISLLKGIDEAANSTAPIPVYLTTVAVLGLTKTRRLATADTNRAVIKNSGGVLYGIQGYNAKASAIFLKIYDLAALPTLASDTPIMTIGVPANSPFVSSIPTLGISFSVGIAVAITGAFGDTDATALAAGDCSVTFFTA